MMQTEIEPLVQRADLIDLASFDDPQVAAHCCQYLNEHDIQTQFYDEGDLQFFLFFTKPKASLKVRVKEQDYSESVKLLMEFEQKNPLQAPLIYSCPDCGSYAVEYPQFSRKFITPLVLEWLSNLGLFKKQCYCRKCHSTWPKNRRTGINPRHVDPTTTMLFPPPG